MDEGLLGTTSTSVEANYIDPVKDDILNPEISGTSSVAPHQEAPTPPTSESDNEISGVRNVEVIARAKALHDFVGDDEDDLPFKAGDIINVIDYSNDYWWRGVLGKDVGIFPRPFVELLEPQVQKINNPFPRYTKEGPLFTQGQQESSLDPALLPAFNPDFKLQPLSTVVPQQQYVAEMRGLVRKSWLRQQKRQRHVK
ncbi:hypothetical protein BGX34_001712 [Mortierella sp. NVP85]|nr:hypothetical protein BGX34_001712 [Mortierella sp. NVP85]